MVIEELDNPDLREVARVSFLPVHNGDGYSFGGDTIMTVGLHSINFGQHRDLALEFAERWNERLSD